MKELVKRLWRSCFFFTNHHHHDAAAALITHRHQQVEMNNPSERYCYNPTLHWNPQVEDYFINAYGPHHFALISKALTRPSCYSCIRVNTLRTTTDDVMAKLSKILEERGVQCAFEEKDVSLMLDKRVSILEDASIEKNCGQTRHILKCQLPGVDNVIFVKGSGPHVIEHNFAEDKPPKEVIVSRKCAESVLRGAQVFVPGVLACSAHVEEGDVVSVSVAVEQPTPEGKWGTGITRGTVMQGLQTDPHYIERNGLYIGQGTTTLSRAGIFRASQGVAVDMNHRVFNLPSLNDVLEGEIFLQNLPSIVTAHALDPQQGERILDMCAAPGGKTTAIAILMKDKGEVIAVDRSHNKVLDIQKLAAELGLNCISTYKLDALKSVHAKGESIDMTPLYSKEEFASQTIQSFEPISLQLETMSTNSVDGSGANHNEKFSLEQEKGGVYVSKAEERKNLRRMKNGPGRKRCSGDRVEKSVGFPPDSFDRVLLDAPCSALGLRPRLFTGQETLESLRKHATYQRRMFDQAVQLVRSGGVIVYSTIHTFSQPCSDTMDGILSLIDWYFIFMPHVNPYLEKENVVVPIEFDRCTINPGENEALVRYALDKYTFLSLASQHPRIGGPGLLGRCESSDGFVEEWLRPGEESLVQRFDPSSTLDTIGFFIAKFNVGPKDY